MERNLDRKYFSYYEISIDILNEIVHYYNKNKFFTFLSKSALYWCKKTFMLFHNSFKIYLNIMYLEIIKNNTLALISRNSSLFNYLHILL